MNPKQLIKAIKFDEKGLVPAIIQDIDSGEVVMLGYMNKESILRSFELGETVFWSRSREKFWHKGESSGHIQKILEVRLDCDGDTLLFLVQQEVAACHKGYFSCFFRKKEKNDWKVFLPKVFEPEE